MTSSRSTKISPDVPGIITLSLLGGKTSKSTMTRGRRCFTNNRYRCSVKPCGISLWQGLVRLQGAKIGLLRVYTRVHGARALGRIVRFSWWVVRCMKFPLYGVISVFKAVRTNCGAVGRATDLNATHFSVAIRK